MRKKSSVYQFIIVFFPQKSSPKNVNILVQVYCKSAKVYELIIILPQIHNDYPGTNPRFQICTVAFVYLHNILAAQHEYNSSHYK